MHDTFEELKFLAHRELLPAYASGSHAMQHRMQGVSESAGASDMTRRPAERRLCHASHRIPHLPSRAGKGNDREGSGSAALRLRCLLRHLAQPTRAPALRAGGGVCAVVCSHEGAEKVGGQLDELWQRRDEVVRTSVLGEGDEGRSGGAEGTRDARRGTRDAAARAYRLGRQLELRAKYLLVRVLCRSDLGVEYLYLEERQHVAARLRRRVPLAFEERRVGRERERRPVGKRAWVCVTIRANIRERAVW
eukprot:1025773-Pleurochrysis_carterae.AAC.1